MRDRPPIPTASFSFVSPMGSIQAPQAPASATNSRMIKCAPGPWGDIEYHFMYLEASERMVSSFKIPTTTPRWSFPGATVQQLAAFFDSARVPEAWSQIWLSPPCLIQQDGVLHILPPIEHLEELMPEQRAFIYLELSKSDLNEFHRDPVTIVSGSMEDFLRGTDIAPEHVRWMARMAYQRGGVLCFSDFQALMSRARSDAEAMRLFKACSRTRGIFARLKVTAQSDFKALAHYWSASGRSKDITNMFQSFAENQPPGGIDLIHLLPPLARRLLNSYPSLDLAMHGRMADCHWSSLNFFNSEPRGYFLNTGLAAKHVLENFDRVETPYQFGHVLFFLDEAAGNAYHSCVYLADDLVFTKNGGNTVKPWTIKLLSDVKQIYLTPVTPGRVQGFRWRTP